jgi:hypothetical protein
MSHRKPIVSNIHLRSTSASKRLKLSPTSIDSSSYRNIFEQFDGVSSSIQDKMAPFAKPTMISKRSSSSIARSIMNTSNTKDTNEQLWSTRFQPMQRDALVVHPRKVKELEEILKKSCDILRTHQVNNRLLTCMSVVWLFFFFYFFLAHFQQNEKRKRKSKKKRKQTNNSLESSGHRN